MSTGVVSNWKEVISEIGPIYPFVGSEFFLVILAIVFWLGWHVLQWRMEKVEKAHTLSLLKNPHVLKTVVEDPEVTKDSQVGAKVY